MTDQRESIYQCSKVISEEIVHSSDMEEREPPLPVKGPPGVDYQPLVDYQPPNGIPATNASDYLDGSSTDPEILYDLGCVGRHTTYITENFNTKLQACIPEITLERRSIYTTHSDLHYYMKYCSIPMEEVNYEPVVGLGPTLFPTQEKDCFYEEEMIPQSSGHQSEALAQVLYRCNFSTVRNIIIHYEESLIKSYIKCVLSISDDDKLILLSAVNYGLENMSSKDKLKLFQIISYEKEIKLSKNIATNLQDVSINENNWREVMINLTRLQLLEKPAGRSVADEFQRCMNMGECELYSIDEAKQIINNLNPIADSIIKNIKLPTPLTENEMKVVQFLFRFIISNCGDRKFAQKFLMYCTCSSLSFEPINISFNAESGLMRAVTTNTTINTCTNLLHIPTTYDSYGELEKEFMNILKSNESFIFSSN